MKEYKYIVTDRNGKRIGSVDFGKRKNMPAERIVNEAVRESFPNGSHAKLSTATDHSANE